VQKENEKIFSRFLSKLSVIAGYFGKNIGNY
jgi:hypothetical protein